MNFHSIKLLATESQKNLILALLSLLLIILACIKISELFINATDNKKISFTEKTMPLKTIKSTDSLFTKPIFGENNSGSISRSNLNIKIVGILFSTPKNSQVIIKEDNNEKVYKVGDYLSNGAELHAINPDNIVINYNDKLEQLDLPKETVHFVRPEKLLIKE